MTMMSHLPQIITTVGLFFDIVGAWLVAAEVYKTYEGPIVTSGWDNIGNKDPEYDEYEKGKIKTMRWGLYALVIGFILQGIGTWLPVFANEPGAPAVRAEVSLSGTSPSPWIPVVAAIGGAMVGGLLPVLSSYFIDTRKRKEESDSVKTALLAEISGIIATANHRRYVSGMRLLADQLRANPQQKITYRVRIPDHYSRIYVANIGKLGVIDSALAAKVIEFHCLVEAVVQDISAGGLIAEEGGDYKAFEELISIAEAALAIASEISSS